MLDKEMPAWGSSNRRRAAGSSSDDVSVAAIVCNNTITFCTGQQDESASTHERSGIGWALHSLIQEMGWLSQNRAEARPYQQPLPLALYS
jgi:hypothetical protein